MYFFDIYLKRFPQNEILLVEFMLLFVLICIIFNNE